MKDKTIIIAEAGVNHNGDINIAKKLIDCAVDAGVDYIKFQTFKAEKLVSLNAEKAEYQLKNAKNKSESQYSMLKKLELSDKDHRILIDYCNSKKINFFSTAFDVDGIKYLSTLNFDFLKIPSGEITNFPYLKAIGETKKPVVLSTGMATMNEIENALKILISFGTQKEEITVLHCNTEYPTPMKDVNLLAMLSIKKNLGVNIGYSDHTLGIEIPIAAVALGAQIIEKHFTLDRNLDGPDHKASLEPDELKKMVQSIKNIELAVSGNGIKEPSESEKKNLLIARKGIYLKNDLKKGSIIKEHDIISLRPCNGISSIEWASVIGKKLTKDHKAMSCLYKDSII